MKALYHKNINKLIAVLSVNFISMVAIFSHESYGIWGLPSLFIIFLLFEKNGKKNIFRSFLYTTLFLILFAVANIILFGGVYWSKFAHMFYKPGAAIQKNLAKADGSNDDLPQPADAPEEFGLGISREKPKHY